MTEKKTAEEKLDGIVRPYMTPDLTAACDLAREAIALLRAVRERIKNDHNGNLEHEWSCGYTHGTGLPCDCGHDEIIAEIDKLLDGEP